jgi:hypothetical protein
MVGPFSGFQTLGALLPVTMSRSDSRIYFRAIFLSLTSLTRLAPAVGAAGYIRASQVPIIALNTCHALGPRRIVGDLASDGLFHVGFRERNTVPIRVWRFRG